MDKGQLTDLSYLREVAMGDDEIVIETTEAFLDDTPSVLKKLQDSFANQRWEEVARQAHKIKPGLNYMGMEQALELVEEIEKQTKSGEIQVDLGDKIKKLKTLCSQARDELSEKIEEIKS